MKVKILVLVVMLCISCSDFELFKGVKISQYAATVLRFSSQYSSNNWSATKALGEQDVFPNYGDNPRAWASLTENGQREFLELGFETTQTVRTIQIYETYNPGAIDTVYLRNSTSKKWIKVYAKPAVTNLPEESRIFTIQLIETEYFADAIRLAINSPEVSGWNEIDAVAVTGQRK